MPQRIRLLKNPIMHYEWGSPTAIPELLGEPNPDGKPCAELWMGAHPKAPSVAANGEPVSLLDWIAEAPEKVLGRRVAAAFGGQLPYLFKALAAGEPLSIQAHPNLDQAREGFERENREGVPIDAFHRNYRDANHKPELICALTKFWALKGFRPIHDTLAMFDFIRPATLQSELRILRMNPNPAGLREFFAALMTLPRERQAEVVREVVDGAAHCGWTNVTFDWLKRLNDKYPGDIGVLSAILLNIVLLEPGQGLYQEAGELHAYLDGFGIELMANSDNVLRGGLTPKHIDVPELLRILEFNPRKPEILAAQAKNGPEKIFRTPAREFRLSVIELDGTATYESLTDRGAEILFCVEGELGLVDAALKETLALSKGQSAIVPASVACYFVEGAGEAYKASTP